MYLRTLEFSQTWWYMTIIPATRETKDYEFKTSPGKVSETPISKAKYK
jgi:hypothetical protein